MNSLTPKDFHYSEKNLVSNMQYVLKVAEDLLL